MREHVKRLRNRERLEIQSEHVVNPNATPVQVVSPAITRQPAIDAMLGDMAVIAKIELERMRNKVMGGQFLEKQEKREFKDICETVMRQARVEMEVERFVAEKTSSMTTEQIETVVTEALEEADMAEAVSVVLEALGISTRADG